MEEIKANIWTIYQRAKWIVIPTNGMVKNNGEAVMGRGLALHAARRFPHLPKALGRKLNNGGNHVYSFHVACLITFPVKENFYENASLTLIERSAEELVALVEKMRLKSVYLPRVGCGNGKLEWKKVKPILKSKLDGRFFVVTYEE